MLTTTNANVSTSNSPLVGVLQQLQELLTLSTAYHVHKMTKHAEQLKQIHLHHATLKGSTPPTTDATGVIDPRITFMREELAKTRGLV